MGYLDSLDIDLSALGEFPALIPPPGVQPNFVNPFSRGPDVVIASSICLALMLVMVIVRFFTKLYIKHRWGWDDCE